MKFQIPKDKYEALFHGFYLLYDPAADPAHINELSKLIMVLLMDPEITQEQVQSASNRAIQAHENEKKLEASFNV